MASVSKVKETKDGRRYWKISVSRGYGVSPYTTRFYWPFQKDGKTPVSKKTAEKALDNAVMEFSQKCANGKVESRAERKEREAAEAAEAAKAAAQLKTVKEFGESVYMARKTVVFSENSRSSYEMFLHKHIYPKLGNMNLVDLTPAIINAFLLEFQQKGYSHATVTKCFNILNGLVRAAYLDDVLLVNPMDKVSRPKPRKDEMVTSETVQALTPEQIQYVFDCIGKEVQEAAKKGSAAHLSALKWQAYITLAYDSAARRGELIGLQWADVDWKSGTITIRRNVQYSKDKGVYVASPKNGKKRLVDVGADTLALLQQLRAKQSASCVSKWIFTRDDGPDVMFPTSPTRFFKVFGDRHGLKNFHPHLLRHSSASIGITNGADVASTSARLGHSDSVVTMRMYVHANEESIRRAGQTSRDAIKGAQNG